MKRFLEWIGLKENCTKQNTIRECALLLMALAVWTEAALARSYLNCLTKKVVIVDAPRGSTSSSIEENVGFWIDEGAKILMLADGTPLTVRRFDDRWISAVHGDMSYELDRQNGNLTYASSTTKEGDVTIIIGSGRCNITVRRGDQTTHLATRFPAASKDAAHHPSMAENVTNRLREIGDIVEYGAMAAAYDLYKLKFATDAPTWK